MEDETDGSLTLFGFLLNIDICKWAMAPGPAFISVSSVLKLVISGAHTHKRTHTYACIHVHAHTHIDESCLQANWNLDMDYSCLVDEPGESPNYEFQTSWPRCLVYDTILFWLFLRWKMLLVVSLSSVKMQAFRLTFNSQFSLSPYNSYPAQSTEHNTNFWDHGGQANFLYLKYFASFSHLF